MRDAEGRGNSGVPFEGYELPPFMTVEDVAALLSGVVRRRTVVRWCKRGMLRATKPGKTWLIRASHFVEDWDALERGAGVVRRARATGSLLRPTADAAAPRPGVRRAKG